MRCNAMMWHDVIWEEMTCQLDTWHDADLTWIIGNGHGAMISGGDRWNLSLALVSAVATRWTSTWLSAVSVLQVRDALVSVFTASAAKERVQEALISQAVKDKVLRDVLAIVRDPSFFDTLGAHLDALIPTIESSIVMQGGSATLADAMYCFARQYQALCAAGEDAVIAKLEKRYARLEKPLLILAIWLHPSYTEVARAVVDSGVVDIMTLSDWVDKYGERWGFKNGAISAALAAQDWSLRYEAWARHSDSFGIRAGKYWAFVLSSSPASSRSDDVLSRRLLAQVARKLLVVQPNAADPERVFSELGHMITPSRTSLADAQSARMLFISADCRAQEREEAADSGFVMRRTIKKFSERAVAVVRLNAIGRQSVAVLSDVPQGDVVEVPSGSPSPAGEYSQIFCGAGSNSRRARSNTRSFRGG
jgi:hypothetical protein